MKYLLMLGVLTMPAACSRHKVLDCLSRHAGKTASACCSSLALSKKLCNQTTTDLSEANTSETPTASTVSLLEWNEDIFTW